MLDRPTERRTSRLGLVVSGILHTAILSALFVFAAREGMLGKQLKNMTVTMVTREKPPEKPKEKPLEPKPAIEKPETEPAKAIPTTPSEVPKPVAIPSAAPRLEAPPPQAPPPSDLPAFDFEGGKAVETTSNPVILYKSYLEFALSSRWNRPEGNGDLHNMAEVEVSIGSQGDILRTDWKKGSGDPAWDDSVRKVLAETKSIGRAPPKGFPDQLLLRFDVQVAADSPIQ